MKHPTVFLDQDGTIIKYIEWLNNPDEVEFRVNTEKGLSRLHDAGYKLVIITNQSGIAKGLVQEKNLKLIHEKIENDLKKHGIKFWKIFYCPHDPLEKCSCRKPKTGMIDSILKDVDFPKSCVIGDSEADIEFGKNLGIKTILISQEKKETKADHVVKDLLEAAEIMLQHKSYK
ncbi:MAG: D-glycero-alpha-D-manno-heptose-1,7-bisphosphate 7-phosphatase [Candidatus Nanoarchaeia archaeon]